MEPPAGELPPLQAPQKGRPALGLDSSAHGLHGSRWSACCRGRHRAVADAASESQHRGRPGRRQGHHSEWVTEGG